LADAGFKSGANFREREDRKMDRYIQESSEKNIGQELKPKTDLYAEDKFQYDEGNNCYK
jgi:hypothetical protein